MKHQAELLRFMREQYPPGTRIRLTEMQDPYAPVPPGTEGEVNFIDDAAQIHMKWSNGRMQEAEDDGGMLADSLSQLRGSGLDVQGLKVITEKIEITYTRVTALVLKNGQIIQPPAAEKGAQSHE